MSLTLAVRRAKLLAIRDHIDAGGGGAVHIFGSTRPATGEPSAEPPLLIGAFGPVSFALHATYAILTCTLEANVAVSGLPVWARFVDGAGVAVMDMSAGLPGSGAQVIVSDGQPVPSMQMYVGGLVTINCSLMEPE
ncbi:MAG: hypothetical protein A2W72_24270 [Burkholderiales bacterium RIFCSPLOWO2_12_67_14]|nr:MAG: hypothetical protein A3I64_07030 [Burkholderiales bacterium RIFCSPLOWO2_02_FULL_67_64]OGB39991.1 MAG: hypothetical protein A3E51_05315 [Burkholderiales bacterium RIFCSPHIGHO2_12_FULL_67_38]OGB43971.1 MAG: hypothetical protein A2W72_24270 [Burkholderiales bacterium RIFCSPLOWO2_12_67_14]OGB87176.1 MAG: hypothetical protein A3G82_19400 [Burkholderiales bacterium RIFCSPLOWO2_12_FULL_67_210]